MADIIPMITQSYVNKSQRSGRILFVDAFDSFSNNIIGLLENSLSVHVVVVRIDDNDFTRNLRNRLQDFDAVVVGPGPGHPSNSKDVGFIDQLWRLQDTEMLPVFGICLGFQSLSLAHGAVVERLHQARHGLVTNVTHKEQDIFNTIESLEATSYHSLRVQLQQSSNLESPIWTPSELCPTLQPLAWDLTDPINGPILMSVKHTEKPFWGVQFHPESICTSKEGVELIQNWWFEAQSWSESRRTRLIPEKLTCYNVPSIPSSASASSVEGDTHSPESDVSVPVTSRNFETSSRFLRDLWSIAGPQEPLLRWASCQINENVNSAKLCEALGLHKDHFVLLDSQGHQSGRFSIIGVIDPNTTTTVSYSTCTRIFEYKVGSKNKVTIPLDSIEEVWPMLQEALEMHDPTKTQGGTDQTGTAANRIGMDRTVIGHLPEDVPFWGGFIGFMTYEAGLETIDVKPHDSHAATELPDISLSFVHRSIVIDHQKSRAYVQSLLPNDWSWIMKLGVEIEAAMANVQSSKDIGSGILPWYSHAEPEKAGSLERILSQAKITTPEESFYRSKVLRCQEALASGDSYELCLTDETRIMTPKAGENSLDPWTMYKKLRHQNPAPFGSYLNLSEDLVVVGTSPERFLRWSREGHCQLRPIKGTVKKTPDTTREYAESILNSSKERAENLMILDLIRHDISGVLGAENVNVTQVMAVEEYEKVFQLVSVIEGNLPRNPGVGDPRGLDVLAASLPPGSMTGAPKKRSCEILTEIEQRPRGIYSGVIGYLDVGGGGDFSVVIRTAVKAAKIKAERCSFSKDKCSRGYDTWVLGAGGAVTIQSTDEGEYLEMNTKVMSVLDSFLKF